MIDFNTLSEDCHFAVMKWLSRKELFTLKQLNRRMNELVGVEMRSKIKAIVIKTPNTYFSDCSNLGPINKDQILVLKPKFGDFLESSTKTQFLGFLTKLAGVKSLNFDYFKLPNELLQEMVGCFPQLEFMIVDESNVKAKDWNGILDQVGDKLVYFRGSRYNFESDEDQLWLSKKDGLMLEKMAAKCPNIKRIEWSTNLPVFTYLMAVFEALPKSCCISIRCKNLDDEAIIQHVDKLEVQCLDWSILGLRVERLSSLTFQEINHGDSRFCGVHFVNLKKLRISEIVVKHGFIDSLCNSQFPRLEEFSFEAANFIENNYQALFQRMSSVKKLAIDYVRRQYFSRPKLPKSAVFLLKNLEEIAVQVDYVQDNWPPENFLRHLEIYVDKVGPLKKLTVGIGNENVPLKQWEMLIKEELKRIKEKQNRVAIKLVAYIW